MGKWLLFLPPILFAGLAALFWVGMHREGRDDLPSTLETLTQSQPSQHVPNVPVIEAAPAIPLPEAQPELSPAPSIQLPEAPPKIPQQVDPSAVNRILRPPMWPRLGSTAGTYRSAPVAPSGDGDDAALPVIQPGRKI